MPRLPTPQSTPKLPEQIFTAASQGAAEARAQAEFGGAIAQAGQRVGAAVTQRKTQGEISKLNAEFAKSQAELTVQWKETLRTADPNDPETAERFRNDVIKPRIEAMREFANTSESKSYFQRAASGLGAGFLVTTEAGQQGLRETAAVQNWETSLNQMGDSVTNDPLSFDTTLAMIDIQVDGLVVAAGLSTGKGLVLKAEARTSLAISAATGLINQDPEAGRAEVEAGAFSEFIDGQQKQRLLAYADTQERAQAAAREKARKDRNEARALNTINTIVNKDGSRNINLIPQAQAGLFQGPDVDLDEAISNSRFLDWLGTDAANAKVNSPAIQNDLLRRAAAGDLTVTEAMDFVGRGVDHSFLTNQLVPTITRSASAEGRTSNARLDAFFDRTKTVLGLSGSLFALPNPRASAAFADFEGAKRLEFQQGLEDGKTASQLLDPGSPDFIGGDLETFVPQQAEGAVGFPIQFGPEFSPRFTPTGTTPGTRKRTPEELDKLLSE